MIKIEGYTEDELNYIINNYNKNTVKELSIKLNKSENNLYRVIRKLGLKKQNHKQWSEDEKEYLRNNYMKTSEEIAIVLSRSITSINAQREALGLIKHDSWTQNEIEFLKESFISMTHKEIADKINRSEQAVRVKCFDLDLFKKEKPWTENEIQYLKDNYREKTKKEISDYLGRSQDAVQIKARKIGLRKYPYTCNYRYFEKIDTEDKAYWLGFLTADGWISMNRETNSGVIGVEIQYGDREHLKKLNNSLQGNYKITDRWRNCTISNKDTKVHSCTLRIFSVTMYKDLINLGFTNNKSFDSKIPLLQNDLYRHFIRGYFDGNGSIGLSNNRFGVRFCTASKTFKDRLIEILKEENISISPIEIVNENNNVIYYPEALSKKDKISLLDYMYKDSTIYLDRKYKKYLKVKELHNT